MRGRRWVLILVVVSTMLVVLGVENKEEPSSSGLSQVSIPKISKKFVDPDTGQPYTSLKRETVLGPESSCGLRATRPAKVTGYPDPDRGQPYKSVQYAETVGDEEAVSSGPMEAISTYEPTYKDPDLKEKQ